MIPRYNKEKDTTMHHHQYYMFRTLSAVAWLASCPLYSMDKDAEERLYQSVSILS